MMNWRSRPLALFLPIAFLLLLEPERAWARGRGHGHGQHHGRHHPAHHHFFGFGHPYGYAQGGYGSPAGCGQTVVPGSPQPPPRRHRPRGRPAEMPAKVERPRRRSLAATTRGWARVPSGLRSSRAPLGRGAEGPPRAVWQAGPCPGATTKSGVPTPGQPTVMQALGTIRQVQVMALKKVCRGQRRGRSAGFVAV